MRLCVDDQSSLEWVNSYESLELFQRQLTKVFPMLFFHTESLQAPGA